MFKRKKIMVLCATTLAGVSALGSLAPMVTFADATKEGQTTVVYEGTPKPAEWGLSVPSAVKLDKEGTPDEHRLFYENAKIAIVDTQGQDLVDASKDRTFSISGQGGGMSGNLSFVEDNGTSHSNILFSGIAGNQGDAEPTEITDASWKTYNNHPIKFDLETKADGTNAKAERWIQFMANKPYMNPKINYHETVSWTATEKDA